MLRKKAPRWGMILLLAPFAMTATLGMVCSSSGTLTPSQATSTSMALYVGQLQADATKVVSEANLNNAQATSVVVLGFANATAIIADSNYGGVAIYKEGQGAGYVQGQQDAYQQVNQQGNQLKMGLLQWLVVGLVVVFIVFGLVGLFS